MPRNGSGNFALASPPAPFVNGTIADATGVMAVLTDIAAGLSQSVSADGQTPVTNNWSLGGHDIRNVGNITVANTATFGPMNKLVNGLVRIENDAGIALNVMNNTSAAGAVSMVVRNDRTDGIAIQFQAGASTFPGSITQNGTTTSYNTSSDARLKTSFGEADTGAMVDAVRVHDAEFKAMPGKRAPMFFAHELAEVCPWAVVGERDGTYRDGSIKAMQVNHSGLVALLWNEVRALRRRVAALEAR